MICIKISALYLLLFSAFAFIPCTARPMAGKPIQDMPMKASKIKMPDGEYIRMGAYSGGEKTEEWDIVTRIDRGKTARIYWQALNIRLKQKLPSHYTNFCTYNYTVDLENGNQLFSTYQNPVTNEKGVIRSVFRLNMEKSEVESETEIWDGNDIKNAKTRTPVRRGFAVIDPGMLFFAPRFLDVKGSGIIYICEPRGLKNPLPVFFRYIGKEKVKTPAGEFDTFKVSWIIADPFLAKLLQPYIKESFLWVEDSPRLLVVKTTGFNDTRYILEEVSTAGEKGWK